MKLFLILGAILVTSSASGQTPETPIQGDASNTNVIIMRGLHRSPSSMLPRPRMTGDAVKDALQVFSRDHNEDGSWGVPSAQMLATPLVFMAYWASAETEHSEKYGSTVAKARKWLLEASPTSDEERIGHILALAVYALITEQSAGTAAGDIEKIKTLLATMTPRDADPWTDLLISHRLPTAIPRPSWAQPTRKLKAKWETAEINLAPISPLGYLELRLSGLARF